MHRGHALITGAIGGLGTAMTKRLVADGIAVIGCDRKTPAELEAWRQQVLTAEEAAHSRSALGAAVRRIVWWGTSGSCRRPCATLF